MKRALKSTYDLAVNAAAPVLRRRGRRLILCYHRVIPPGGAEDSFHSPVHSVSLATLRAQMTWLQEFCHFCRLDEIVASAADGDPRWRVAVTFDDGYRDNLTHAFPLLAEMGIPATWFVTTGFVADPARLPWWDLATCIAGLREGRISVPLSAAGGPEALDLARLADRNRLIAALTADGRAHAKRDAPPPVAAQVEAALAQRGQLPANAFVRPDGITAAARRPLLEIAPHSVTHPEMARLPAAAQRREIVDSRAQLMDWGASPSDWFAYPFGAKDSYDDTTVAILRDLGLRGAVTTRRAALGDDSDPYRLPRISVDARWSPARFRARLLAAAGAARA